MTVGDELRAIRLDRGLTQHEVARLMEVNRNFVYEFELSKRTNTIFALQKVYLFIGHIPHALNIDKNTLAGRLFAFRIRNGYTYQQVAKMIGIDKRTLIKASKGTPINESSRRRIIDSLLP